MLLVTVARHCPLAYNALDVPSRLSEEHGDDAKRDERHSAEHHEPFEHHAAKWRKSHGTGALDGSTLDRHPHKTASLTAPVLDASRNRKVVQLNFAHADRLMAARTLRNRYAVRRRSMKQIERRHTHLGMGGQITLHQFSLNAGATSGAASL